MSERLTRRPDLDRPEIVLSDTSSLDQLIGMQREGDEGGFTVNLDRAIEQGYVVFQHPRQKMGIGEAIKQAVHKLVHGN